MPLFGDRHRGLSHLLQDLVVNLGLKRAKKDMTSFQVRQLLVHIPGKLVPARPSERPNIDTGGQPEMRLGDYAWQLTYDLTHGTGSTSRSPRLSPRHCTNCSTYSEAASSTATQLLSSP